MGTMIGRIGREKSVEIGSLLTSLLAQAYRAWPGSQAQLNQRDQQSLDFDSLDEESLENDKAEQAGGRGRHGRFDFGGNDRAPGVGSRGQHLERPEEQPGVPASRRRWPCLGGQDLCQPRAGTP